jgi:hypothetical protein
MMILRCTAAGALEAVIGGIHDLMPVILDEADGGRLDEPAREEPALAKAAARARAFSSARDAAGVAAREEREKRGSHAPQGAEGMFKTPNASSIHMRDARGIFL